MQALFSADLASKMKARLEEVMQRYIDFYKFYNKIVGDSAEKEKERQDLLQVVQHSRRENPDLLKATLAKK